MHDQPGLQALKHFRQEGQNLGPSLSFLPEASTRAIYRATTRASAIAWKICLEDLYGTYFDRSPPLPLLEQVDTSEILSSCNVSREISR